jgi:glyoxylase-like metal-dependent hydrolase (beta-lactamase superfamily II)
MKIRMMIGAAAALALTAAWTATGVPAPFAPPSGHSPLAAALADPPGDKVLDPPDPRMSDPAAERRMIEHAVAVAPHIHVLTAPATSDPAPLANEIVIEQADGLVLVDAGKTRGAGKRVVALIRKISPKPVKFVVITHWHGDHLWGLGPIVEAWPKVKIVSSVRTADSIAQQYKDAPESLSATAQRDRARAGILRGYGTDLAPKINDRSLSEEERRGWAEMVGVLALRTADEKGSYLVRPNVTFSDQFLIPDPEAPVEARFIGPGHTDGDVIAWMPRQGVVASGDLVVAPIPFGGTNMLEWPETLDRLAAYSPKFVVPGHGPVLRGAAYVTLLANTLREVRRQAQALAAGTALTDEQVAAKTELSRSRSLFAGHDKWRAYWFDQYVVPDVVEAYHELLARKASGPPAR